MTFVSPHMNRAILAIIVSALASPIPTLARAEVRVEGAPEALSIEANDSTLQDVLAALSISFGLQYRASSNVNRPVSGTYEGSLRVVVSRLLEGYDYFMRNSDGHVEIVVVSVGAAGTAPQFAPAPPPHSVAADRRF